MRKTLMLLSIFFAAVVAGLGQDAATLTGPVIPQDILEDPLLFPTAGVGVLGPESVADQVIRADDVEEDSIKVLPFSTDRLYVRWTYTKEGAEKMLAFWESHRGQTVRTVSGTFESKVGEVAKFQPMPPAFTTYAEWREGWLRSRTDDYAGLTREEARKLVAGLKGKSPKEDVFARRPRLFAVDR